MTYKPRPWLAAALVAVTLALVVFAFYEAGPLLVVEDPLQKARAVVVFGGGIPFRAMEAAKLYRQGWAPEVWLSQGGWSQRDVALARLEVERTPEHLYSLTVLERSGVPSSAIRVLPGRIADAARNGACPQGEPSNPAVLAPKTGRAAFRGETA